MKINIDSLEVFKTNKYVKSDIGMVSDNAYLSVVVTNRCQRNCFYCINSETDHSLKLPIDKAVNNINKLKDKYNIKEVILLGGEPLLHPDICELVKLLSKMGLKVRLTTNGIMLKENRFLIDSLIDSGLFSINISYHNEDFISLSDLRDIYQKFRSKGIKVRINTNIWVGNNDTIQSFVQFYNTIKRCCDEVRVSNLIEKDSFSVNSKNKDLTKICSKEFYDGFFEQLIKNFSNDVSSIVNEQTLGFVKYVLLPLPCPIIVNWNTSSTVGEQVCENNLDKRKINTFKCLVSGDISLSWNTSNIISN